MPSTSSQDFQDTVNRIVAAPPTRGFGAKHYRQGLDPHYRGSTYGHSTVADAYYRAGVKARKNAANQENNRREEPRYVFRLDIYLPESHDSVCLAGYEPVFTGYYFTMTGALIGASLRCRRLGGYNYRIEREIGTDETIAQARRARR